MENKNLNHFEVRITDVRTGEEKYVGLSNCIFLASSEDGGTRLLRLSCCDLITKASCYHAVKLGLEDTLKDELIIAALILAISSQDDFIVKEDV